MGDAYREATEREQKERDEGHNRNRKGVDVELLLSRCVLFPAREVDGKRSY